MKIDSIVAAFRDPDVKVVSFDIFDTLVERPALEPQDIFILLNKKVQALLGNRRFDFHGMRKRIEAEAVAHFRGNQDGEYTLSFHQIYDYIAIKYRIPAAQIQEMMDLEIALERQLLAARRDGSRLYDAAVAAGKRVICISDMYHERVFLGEILSRNGFRDVSQIYVSSEIKKRKDSGKLFAYVLAAEGLDPQQLVHVGDHRESDYTVPLAMGITCLSPAILTRPVPLCCQLV